MKIKNNKFQEKIINDMKSYIHNNIYGKRINAKDVCLKSGYSNHYMHRLFRQTTGQSLLSYINDVRIEKITYLVINTDLTLTEIASKLGFASLNDLTKFFKKRYGFPPSHFRKKVPTVKSFD